jgi:hypothetical protein
MILQTFSQTCSTYIDSQDGDMYIEMLCGWIQEPVTEEPKKTTSGGEWEPIKITYWNLVYVLK